MAVTGPSQRVAPMWLTWALVGALLAVFLGERVLDHLETPHLAFTALGVLGVVGATVWRGLAWSQARGERRRVEGLLFFGYVGCAVSLLLYALGTDWGLDKLGLDLTGKTRERWQGALSVLWPIAMAASLVPTLAAQWAVGAGGASDGEGVERHRVAEAASNGLTVALAGCFLFVACYIVSERDHKWDLSYFRTSSPGSATVNMVSSLSEPLRVLLFFPEVNEVKDEVRAYFEQIGRRTDKLQIEEHDRLVDGELAKKYRVSRDGVVVLVKGEQSELITLDPELKNARNKLRTFDEEVQKAFLKVARGSRVAYLTTGHGELNDPPPPGETDPTGLSSASVLKEFLGLLNYRVKDLGLKNGLASDVPDDATIVFVLGPKKAFLPEELASLDRYLARGGALLLALDPGTEFILGPLAKRLGVDFKGTRLADDRQFVARRRNASDHELIVTDQFSVHASVTTLARQRVGAGILLAGAGQLVDVPLEGEFAKNKRTHVIRSLGTTFSDDNGDFLFTEGEKRQPYNLVAAVEGPEVASEASSAGATEGQKKEGDGVGKDEKKDDKAKGEKKPGDGARPMRAMVLADSNLLSDALLLNVALHRGLLHDAVMWLGGEEAFMGETTSEKDVPIEHTKSQDVAWFYSTIIGAPLVVLAGGLAGVYRRRRGSRRKA